MNFSKKISNLLTISNHKSLLAVIPVVSIVQIYVYLSKGPRDILEVNLFQC